MAQASDAESPQSADDPERVPADLAAHYLDLTRVALSKARISVPDRSHLRPVAEDFREMAERYLRDGEYFRGRGDTVRAFACANYAHGWLDAGARLGLFDVGGDDRLFTLAR